MPEDLDNYYTTNSEDFIVADTCETENHVYALVCHEDGGFSVVEDPDFEYEDVYYYVLPFVREITTTYDTRDLLRWWLDFSEEPGYVSCCY